MQPFILPPQQRDFYVPTNNLIFPQLPNHLAPTPEIHTETPAVQATTPAVQAPTPAIQAPTPAVQVTNPAIQAATPVVQAATPAVQAESPAVQAAPPASTPAVKPGNLKCTYCEKSTKFVKHCCANGDQTLCSNNIICLSKHWAEVEIRVSIFFS